MPRRPKGESSRQSGSADLASLTEKVDELLQEVAVLKEKSEQAEEDRDALMQLIGDIRRELNIFHSMAARWKGGLITLAALGGVVGWVLTQWDHWVVILRGTGK